MSDIATGERSVLIIEDHSMTREGIKVVLSWGTGFAPIFEAATAKHGLEVIRTERPALVILDLSLPDRNGLEIIGTIRNLSPESRILVLSMYTEGDYIRKALSEGVHGYIAKASPPENLLRAVRQVMDGGYYFDQSSVDEIVQFLSNERTGKSADEESAAAELSKREMEILRLVVEGYSVKEIAFMLSISAKTVENHRYRLMRKLNVTDSFGLLRFALKRGLVSMDEWLK